MSRVVIVGGGLSGLAAAALLEQQAIDYTLIEVKRRVGGSLISSSANGFLFDGAGFVSDGGLASHPLIETWGLRDSLIDVEGGVIVRQGVQSLIDALSARVTGPRLMRMAVSSIGDLEGGSMALCLENGLMLNARAIILALPARYAERIFYGYHTEITEHLLPYRYDRLMRVSLGYRTLKALPTPSEAVFQHHIEDTGRGGTLVQVGLHLDQATLTDDEVRALCESWSWPAPEAVFVHHWSEADPLTPHTPEYSAWRESLMAMLPPRVALIGSDFVPAPLSIGITPMSQCLTQAQDAVSALLNQL